MPIEQPGDSLDGEHDAVEVSLPTEQIGGVALSDDPTQRTILKGSDNLPDSEIPRLEALNGDESHPRYDKELAHDMALEEDEINYDHPDTKDFRANASDGGTAVSPDYGRGYAARLRDDVRKAKDAGAKGTMKSGHFAGAGTKRDSWVETTTSIPALEDEARRIDRKASERGDWVKFLHEHPVPQEYQDRYPHISFTAKGMANLDALTRYRGYDVSTVQEEIDAFSKPSWGRREFGRTIAPYFEEFDNDDFVGFDEEDEGDEEEDNFAGNRVDTELGKLLNNDSTTMGDFKELFKKRAQKKLENLKHDIDEGRQILEDVRRGFPNEEEPSETDSTS